VRDFIDAYAVLGVAPNASQAALKAAHRRLVRTHHPDLHPPEARAAATRRVQEVNVAYGLVRDPRARGAYDRFRAKARRREAVLGADATAAASWDRLATDAGRWAGRWWRRHRGRVRRSAWRARAAGVDVIGRVRWLAACGLWTFGGLTAAVFAQDFGGVEGPVTLLIGGLGGLWLGNRQGWRARLRTAGAPRPPRAVSSTAALMAAGALALLGGVWVDGRF
jgi:hypothetical protein